MLREEDIQIDVGRAGHGGDFMRMVHLPTGIERRHPGPLRDINTHELQKVWSQEIEDELKAKGLMEHIVPDYRTKTALATRPKKERIVSQVIPRKHLAAISEQPPALQILLSAFALRIFCVQLLGCFEVSSISARKTMSATLFRPGSGWVIPRRNPPRTRHLQCTP